MAPGLSYGQARGAAGSRRGWQLLETINPSGWTPLLRRLADTKAHALPVQESKLLPHRAAVQDAVLAAGGWRAFHAQSVVLCVVS